MEKISSEIKVGDSLYCTLIGNCVVTQISSDGNVICVTPFLKSHRLCLDGYGRYHSDGECVLFPSREWRRWDLKPGSPVMVQKGEDWVLRYFSRTRGSLHYVFPEGRDFGSEGYYAELGIPCECYKIVVPYEDFNPLNIEESLVHQLIPKRK